MTTPTRGVPPDGSHKPGPQGATPPREAVSVRAGYRATPRGGPGIRTDIVDIYIFRRCSASPGSPASGRIEFLQLLRAAEPLANTWHPVMGHVETGETALACAVREVREEVGLDLTRADSAVGVWALQRVVPFYVAALDQIVLSPRFCCEVPRAWEPSLNAEHGEARWVGVDDVARRMHWPGQLDACREIAAHIAPHHALARNDLAIPLPVRP